MVVVFAAPDAGADDTPLTEATTPVAATNRLGSTLHAALPAEDGPTDHHTVLIFTNHFPEATVGQSYQVDLESEDGPVTWSASGLPEGLTLDPITGAITGVPVDAGEFAIEVTTTDEAGQEEVSHFSLVVENPAASASTSPASPSPIPTTPQASPSPSVPAAADGGGMIISGQIVDDPTTAAATASSAQTTHPARTTTATSPRRTIAPVAQPTPVRWISQATPAPATMSAIPLALPGVADTSATSQDPSDTAAAPWSVVSLTLVAAGALIGAAGLAGGLAQPHRPGRLLGIAAAVTVALNAGLFWLFSHTGGPVVAVTRGTLFIAILLAGECGLVLSARAVARGTGDPPPRRSIDESGDTHGIDDDDAVFSAQTQPLTETP
ncbi:MAG: putative Ig domain-containing protein [Propionibacteriaceae bacterium]|nr:putative Ig domain-containing protein [Propionibacteriaceae bacterium]